MEHPLISENCPDPAVFFCDREEPTYWLAASSDNNHVRDKFPLWRSRDLRAWQPAGSIFPECRRPRWAVSDFWAPEIHRIAGRLVCYFTARDRLGRLCIGAAGASRVEGPWIDLGRPLLRDPRVGLIDAHAFRDQDGQHILYWKEDGNDLRPQEPTAIHAQAVADDGLTLVGPRHAVMVNDLGWEGAVVEGPWVVRRGDHYFLFYSGNVYITAEYATGVARSTSPFGPFEKRGAPLLPGCARWRGPGHGCVVTRGGEDYFVYHAWHEGRVHGGHPRVALLSRISWEDGWPRIERPLPPTVALAALA
jgi:arabinan endo-1,5-alpha-L-arabinosidase